jgi:alkylation response protein AidB-like acyl-CoA dehydrogenase
MFYLREQRNVLETLLADTAKYHRVLEALGELAGKEILPHAKKIDQEGIFPRENLERLRGQGIPAIAFPVDLNGLGYPFPVYVTALEMIARACANTALQVSVQGMVCEGIRLFGDERQKNFFLIEKGMVEARSLGAFAITEPCCGSDAKAIQTQAHLSGNAYILNGNKTLITNPGEADFILVFARAEKGISAFIVPRKAAGLEVMKDIPKLGLRGNRLSAMRLEKCEVPKENLLGEEGMGLEYAKQILNTGRITIAAIAVGIAQAAYEKALHYSTGRKAFGESIARFQLVQEKLSDMLTEITAARLLFLYAAALRDRGEEFASEASRAKLFSTEMALRVCDGAIQVHGGYGYIDAYDVHRHWRDARGLTIGEGTSDMLRLFIAHMALKEA